MNFIISNKIFEYILCILLTINGLILMILDNERERKNKKRNNNINKKKTIDNRIFAYKISIIILYFLIFFFSIANNLKTIVPWIIILTSFICFFLSLYKIIKNDNIFSLDNSFLFAMSTILYLIFASSMSTQIYIDTLAQLSHFMKELLLIIYINIRIFFFAYLFLTNLCVLIKYTIILIKRTKLIHLIKKIFNFNFYKIFVYDFNIYRKFQNKLSLTIDFIISFLFDFVLLLISLVFIAIKWGIKKFTKIINNSSKILKSLSRKSISYIKISLIISLIITYFIITFNNFFISEKLKDVYNLITTVILIPIIFDSINSHK